MATSSTRNLIRVLEDIRPFGVGTPEAVTAVSDRAKNLKVTLAKASMEADPTKALASKIAKGEVNPDTSKPYLDVVAYEVKQRVLRDAADLASNEIAWAVMDHKEALMTAIEEKMVTPTIEIFVKAAELTEEGDTLASLLTAGNTEAASALAAAHKKGTFEALAVADSARARLLGHIRPDIDAPRAEWIGEHTLNDLAGGKGGSPDERRARAVTNILRLLRSGEEFVEFNVDSLAETHKSLVAVEMGDVDEETVAQFRSVAPINYYGAPQAPAPVGRVSY